VNKDKTGRISGRILSQKKKVIYNVGELAVGSVTFSQSKTQQQLSYIALPDVRYVRGLLVQKIL
jgi:hypothetical protein